MECDGEGQSRSTASNSERDHDGNRSRAIGTGRERSHESKGMEKALGVSSRPKWGRNPIQIPYRLNLLRNSMNIASRSGAIGPPKFRKTLKAAAPVLSKN